MTETTNTEFSIDIGLVDEQMQLLDKAFRATQLYLPNNPVYQRALTNLSEGMARLWAETDELVLKVTREAFDFEGHALLDGRDKNESLAWLLYKDGIRTVTFEPGVEQEELLDLLAVLNKARAQDAGRAGAEEESGDDLLTLLWMRDYHFFKYRAIELGAEDGAPALETSENYGSFGAPEEMQETIREDAEAEPEQPAAEEQPESETPAGLANVDDFDSTLFFLDKEEIAYIKGEIDREYEQDLHLHVVQVLMDILEFQTYDDARGRVIDILGNLLPVFLGAGDFQAVAYTLAHSQSLADWQGMDESHRAALADIPARLSGPESLAQLLQILDESPRRPTQAQLGVLFKTLQPSSMTTLLAWIPRLHDPEIRRLISEAVDPLARNHPEAIIACLSSDQTPVVMGALGIVARLQLQTVGDALAQVTGHPEEPVRLALVEALSVVATPTAMRQLTTLIDDVSRDVRIAAVKALTERRHAPAAANVEAVVFGKLRGAPLNEKQAFFEALGVLGGANVIDKLTDVLSGKGLFRRKDDPETRACAAMALGKIGEKARPSLESIGRVKDPVIRAAVDKAIREASR